MLRGSLAALLGSFAVGSTQDLPKAAILKQAAPALVLIKGTGPKGPASAVGFLVAHDGRVLAYGSKGADGQPQFQAQVFTRIAAGQPLDAALAAPRHFFTRALGEPAATVKLEHGYDESTAAALVAAGHAIERKSAAERDLFGHAGALMRAAKGEIAAAHDPRSDGGAAGL